MFTIEDVHALYNENAVVLTQHFMDMITKRGISFKGIKTAIFSGEIIEPYPTDYPHPSALILGDTDDNKPLHVVVGVGGGRAWLITSYYPDSEKWESDNKTRKVAPQ